MHLFMKATLTAAAMLGLVLPAFAAEGEVEEDPNGVQVLLGAKGLRFRTNDGSFKFKIGGRIQVDIAGHPGGRPDDSSGFGEVDPTNGIEIRRGRIHFLGTC